VTIFDFELDVKRAGQCHDVMEIFTGSSSSQDMTPSSGTGTGSGGGYGEGSGRGAEYFRECGALGKQIVDIQSSSVQIRFTAGQTSLTQRGFFLYFEGFTINIQ